MRPLVGHVARPPFLIFIAPIRLRLFPPGCSRAKDLNARPWSHVRYEYHAGIPSHFQTPLPVTISRHENDQCLKKPTATFLLGSISRQSSSTSGVSDAPNASRTDLPSHEEGRRSHVSKSFTRVMDHLQSNIFIAGQRLNDLTGYSGIEALKKDIELQGQYLDTPCPNYLSPF